MLWKRPRDKFGTSQGHPGRFGRFMWKFQSERPRSLLLSLGVPSRPSPGSDPGPVQVPSRVPSGPVQIRHVLCFTVFRTHPGPEVGAIPACPGPILVPSVSSRIGRGRAETDFLATSDPIQGAECPRDRRDIRRDRWDVSTGQTGHTPADVPPKFFMFIGFLFPQHKNRKTFAATGVMWALWGIQKRVPGSVGLPQKVPNGVHNESKSTTVCPNS